MGCSEQDCLAHFKRLQIDWSQECYRGNNKVGSFCFFYIVGAKFEEHCFNIFRVILDWVLCCFSGTTYDAIIFFICIIQKLNISKTKNDLAVKENAILFYVKKPFKQAAIILLLHRHFKEIRKLTFREFAEEGLSVELRLPWNLSISLYLLFIFLLIVNI